MKKIIILALASILLTVCAENILNFTIISTKSIELKKFSSLQKSSEKTAGEDKSFIIIVFPTRFTRIDQAVTNTIDAIPGCVALMDGTVYSKFWWIPYIYGEHKVVIEATPIIDPSFSQIATNLPKYGRALVDDDGNVVTIESISEKSFLAEKSKIVKNKTIDKMGAQTSY